MFFQLPESNTLHPKSNLIRFLMLTFLVKCQHEWHWQMPPSSAGARTR